MKDKAGIEVSPKTTETDPNGLKPSEYDAKLDHGKSEAALLKLLGNALIEAAKVGTAGPEKYSRGGWQGVSNGIERYEDAARRHLLNQNEYDGGVFGTGCLHDAQAIWNLLAALELKLRSTKLDR